MAGHRRVRPRYRRLGAAVTSSGVTAVAVLGGVGLLPSAAERSTPPAAIAPVAAAPRAESGSGTTSTPATPAVVTTPTERNPASVPVAPPPGSGEGRRVVFSEGRQRVWIMSQGDRVLRTYPVSGSIYDNLDPGTYTVFSRSMNAVGIDDSGTMRYFVRFARGDSGAAIGFHDIPVDEGVRVQRPSELGTPTSHGCIRQRSADARAMWAFAGLGTTVVVTA